MKKYSLLKAIGVVTIIFMFLTWFIPTGKFFNGNLINDGYEPMGLFDLLLMPFKFFDLSFGTRIKIVDETLEIISYTGNILALLSIGVFYKVINKTGAYGNLINALSNKISQKKNLFVILTIALFSILSAFTGLSLLLFLLVPFFITLLLKQNYSKITAFSTTVLPILVGRACSITGCDITGINNMAYGVSWDVYLIYRLILLVLFIAVTSIYVVVFKSPKVDELNNKRKNKKENVEDPLYEEFVDKNKGYGMLVFFTAIFFLILAICMFNWYYVFNIKGVSEAYNDIMSNTVSGYPFVNNLFGNMEIFGYWTGFSMSAVLLLLSAIIAFIYSLSLDDFISAFKEGISKMSKVAIYVVLASVIVTFINEKPSNIFYTISGFINENITINAVSFSSLMSGIHSIFLNDYYLIGIQTTGMLSSYFSGGLYNISVMCIQYVHGIISIITPTSIFLVAGLSYLDISYKEWFSYIWKLVLFLLTVSILLLLIASII